MATLEEIKAAMAASTLEELGREVTEATTGASDTTPTTETVSSQGVGTGSPVVSSQGVGTGVVVEEVSSQGVGEGLTGTTETVAETVTDTGTTDTTTETVEETTTTESPEQTLEERSLSLADQTQAERAALGDELMGEELNPELSSLQAIVDAALLRQADELEIATGSVATSEDVMSSQIEESLQATESQQAGIRDLMSVSREGSSSVSNLDVSTRLQDVLWDRFDTARTEMFQQQASREQALEGLIAAQESGRSDLITQYQNAINNAELEIQQSETDSLNALTAITDSQSAAQTAQEASARANLASFTSLIQEGTELTTNQIVSFANTLNVPFETAYAYYQGSADVREDKSLDLAEKNIKLEQLYDDFQLEQEGYRTDAAKQIAGYEQIVQENGLTKEEAGELAVMMGIDSKDNPFTQAELSVKEAEAKIKTAEANGEIINPSDQIAYYEELAGLADLYGQAGEAYVPTNSLEGFEVTYEGGILQITGPDNKTYQCGEFVNRVWGLSSGGSGGFGDYYTDKQSLVDSNGYVTEGMNDADFIVNIRPGMAFVSSAGYNIEGGNTGHVGIVTQVFSDGTFLTAETNVQGDGLESSPAVAKLRSYKDGDIYGFAIPPNFSIEGGGVGSFDVNNVTPSQSTILNSFDGKNIPETWTGSDEAFLDAYSQFETTRSATDTPLTTKMQLSAGGSQLLAGESEKVAAFQTVATGLQTLENKLDSVDTDWVAPMWGILQENNPWSVKAAEIDALLTSLTPGLARGVYGEVGVLTDTDIRRYQQLLPTLTDTKSQRDALIDMLKQSLNDGISSTMDSAASNGRNVSRYVPLVEYVSGSGEEVEEVIDPYSIADEYDPARDSFYSEYLTN
ncbi:CHAP domain-containing protein [Candidatus Peregrinibacteria bacterium]|jgi:hypothetical protein|nr:CHAP domain-containing protein [Candidatus Peregrinibacteria bacterium]